MARARSDSGLVCVRFPTGNELVAGTGKVTVKCRIYLTPLSGFSDTYEIL
jgi:hypothetical protein